MTVTTLQQSPSSQGIASSSKAEEKDADFLSLRLLNKRIRVRLSPDPLDLSVLIGKGTFLSIATSKGWFAAVVRSSGTYQIVLSPLHELRLAIASSTADDGEINFTPKRVLALSPPNATPSHVTFAFRDERLVVGLTEGPLLVYDTKSLLCQGNDNVQPLETIQPTGPGAVLQVLANPEDIPELVAVRRDVRISIDALAVEILDVNKLEVVGGWRSGETPATTPTAMSWSPKGKQIALALQSGEIVTFAPSSPSSPRSFIPSPTGNNTHATIFLAWLSNSAFLSVCAPAGQIHDPNVDQKLYLIIHDPRSTGGDSATEFSPPYFPSPGLRPPGAFCTVLKNWGTAKFLTFIGDGTSSDIGLLGCLIDQQHESWHNLTLEETSTPSLPLDKESDDTVLLGLDLDTTYSPADNQEHPPPPVLLAYVSDGTIQAWHVTQKGAGAYSGMHLIGSQASGVGENATQVASTVVQPPVDTPKPVSAFGTSFGFGSQTGAFGQPTATAFTQPSQPAFGQSSFGQSAIGTAPSFGQPSTFKQAASTPAFGQSSLPTSTLAFGGSGSAFGSFAAQGPAKFGAPGFGFGGSTSQSTAVSNAASTPLEQPRQTVPSPPQIAPSPEAEMSDAADSGNLGGLSLGGLGGLGRASSGSSTVTGPNSMFGSFSPTPTQTPAQTTPTSSSSSFMKPATGFGAFANQASNSPFSAAASGTFKPASGFGAFANVGSTASAFSVSSASPPTGVTATESTSSPTFGVSSFGAKPVFGQSTFGQSSFGQSAFGQSAFGKPSTFGSSPSSSIPTGSAFGGSGGFAAFASGSSGFSAPVKTEPVPITVKAEAPVVKVEDTTSTDDGSAFGNGAEGTFGQTATSSPFSQIGTSSTSLFGGEKTIKAEPKEPSLFNNDKSIKTDSSTPTLAPPPMESKSASAMSISESISTGRMAKTPDSSPESSPLVTERKLDRIDELTSMSPEPDDTTESVTQTQVQVPSSPFGKGTASTTPASSPLKPDSGFGAFGGLKSTPSAFGSTTFGVGTSAFGSSSFMNSPFANPKAPTVSAFGSTTPVSTPAKPAAPAFGATSQLGSSVFGKSAFGVSTPVSAFSTTPTKSPSAGGGAFGAYSSGGFSAFAASAAKPASFKDLLKSEKDKPVREELPGSSVPKAAVEAPKMTETNTPKVKTEENEPVIKSEETTKQSKSLQDVKGESSYIEVSSGSVEELDDENLPPTPSTHGTFDEEEEAARRDESGELVVHDDTASFLSDSYTESESAHGQDEEEDADGVEEGEEEEEEEEEEEGELEEIPIPVKQRTSPTSKPPPPASSTCDITPRVSPTPTVSKEPSSDKETMSKSGSPSPSEVPVKAESETTTPPGSPEKKESPPPSSSLFSPKISPTVSASSSTSSSPSPILGLGRPGTRPLRSSPLANPPVISEPIKPVSSIMQGPPVVKPRPASPKLPFGQLPPSFKEPTVPVPTKVPDMSTFKFGLSTSSVFSQQPVTPAKPLVTGFPSPTVTAIPPVFSQPIATAAKATPPVVGSLSPTAVVPGAFSPFKFQTAPAQPPVMSAAAQSLTSPSAPFIFPGAAPVQPQVPTTPVQQTPTVLAARFGQTAGRSGAGLPPQQQGSPQSPQSPPFQTPIQTRTQPQVQMQFDSELQKGCYELYMHTCNELSELQKYAQHATQLRERRQSVSSIATPPTQANANVASPPRQGVDLEGFKRRTRMLMDGISESIDHSKSLAGAVRELESNVLKAETRKEEIIRFSRAKDDPEFAKMLKVRTLGPEAIETQSQLRRQIRMVNDRVEQLEDHLRACKKRLEERRRGKPSFKAPAMDTISRTYRNIDLAIERQNAQIANLTERVARLKLLEDGPYKHASRRSFGSRNSSFNGIDADTTLNGRQRDDTREKENIRGVSPTVAASTAAALNAERSAQRLKNVLTKIRKEPLVNRQAVESNMSAPTLDSLHTRHARHSDEPNTSGDISARPAQSAYNSTMSSFTTPPRASTIPDTPLPNTPLRLNSSLFGTDPGPLATPGPFSGHAGSSPDAQSTPRRGASTHGHDRSTRHSGHLRPVPLKRAASGPPEDDRDGFGSSPPSEMGLGSSSRTGFGLGFGSPTPSGPVTAPGSTSAKVKPAIAAFDWGPLPKAAPRAQISSDVRPGTTGR